MNTEGHTEPARQQSWLSKRRNPSASPLSNIVRSRATRRALVIGSALLLAIAIVLVWFQDDEAGAGSQIAYLVAAALAVGGFSLVSTTLRAHRAGADERLTYVRNQAYRIAYPILGISMGGALLGISLASETEWSGFALEPNHLRALLLGFAATALWLPSGVLAWRETEV